jgi:alpha-D-xyloside xylohydrolase
MKTRVTARYEDGAYATIPIQWNESSKILTIGERAGEFAGMLKQRMFRIVWVRPGKGVGPLVEPACDIEVRYEGKAIQVKAP